MTNYPLLKINTLGSFSVSVGDEKISDNSSRSGQIWKLFKYIITNKATPVSTEKLIDILWPEGNCDNPIKALYSLVYRLRSILKSKYTEAPEFFSFQHNSYIWNNDSPYLLDTEEFENTIKAANSVEMNSSDRISLYRKAFAIYKGDYLSESGHEVWVLPHSNYYKRLYSAALSEFAVLCELKGDYKSIVEYCEKAIAMDLYDETNHITLIKALINMGQFSQAMAHYNYIAALLQKDLGVEPSEQLQLLNRQIRRRLDEIQYDMAAIQNSLSESDAGNLGAYYCDFDVFKSIYRVEKRAIERSGLSVYLCLLSILDENSQIPGEADLSMALTLLKRTVMFSLRRGDVVTQLSRSQLLILLPSATYENCEVVINRLEKKFYSSGGNPHLKILKNIDFIKAN